MKEISEVEKDIASIRNMMERSAKFMSLSGLSGVLAGVYALIGSAIAYSMIHAPSSLFERKIYAITTDSQTLGQILLVAIGVLGASLATGFFFSQRKAKKHGFALWTGTTRKLVVSLAIPLFTGGFFILILLYTGNFVMAAPACLIFYGLALIQASTNTYEEVRYLGFTEITLGLIATALPGYGLLLWATGFGVMHIIYGSIMYYRHDQ